MAVVAGPTKSGWEAVVAVCHHCGRLLSADEVKRLGDDPHFAGRVETVHCVACYHERPVPGRGWKWLIRWVLRWALRLALLLLVGCLIAALVQRNDFGLGALWYRWWPLLDRYWEPLDPILGRWLTALQPVVDLISALLARVLGGA